MSRTWANSEVEVRVSVKCWIGLVLCVFLELSPCLKKFEDKGRPEYREALAIIRSGRLMLAKRPRAEMNGFRPCETDMAREQQYHRRREIERDNREAIRKGVRIYDARSVRARDAPEP